MSTTNSKNFQGFRKKPTNLKSKITNTKGERKSLQQFVRISRPEPQERRAKELGSMTQEIQSRAEKKNGRKRRYQRKRNAREICRRLNGKNSKDKHYNYNYKMT